MKIEKDILEKYHLNIEKISNKGLRIIGEEEDIRSCIKKYNKGNTELSERIQESLNLILSSLNIDDANVVYGENGQELVYSKKKGSGFLSDLDGMKAFFDEVFCLY